MLGPQLDRLLNLGLSQLAAVDESELRTMVSDLPDEPDGMLVVHPTLVSPQRLTPLLERQGKPGFVVSDFTDLDEFVDLEPCVHVPDRPLYVLRDVQRGDELRNQSPNEALPVIIGAGRSPLTMNEGLSWLLQEPEALQPNHCFMTIGSRKQGRRGLDARTPAIWISGGAGRDGTVNAGAPKLGWCWAGNRHTWLGFASTAGRCPS